MTVAAFLAELADKLDRGVPASVAESKAWARDCRDYATVSLNEYHVLEPAPLKRRVPPTKTRKVATT